MKGREINQSVASKQYTFVVEMKNNSSYIVLKQTQARLIFKGSFYLFLWKNIQMFQGIFSSYFFTNIESGISLQHLHWKWKK